MKNFRNINNVINNNDFFKIRKTEEGDNKRIYDLDIFYLKKHNMKNKNRNNFSNNSYQFKNNNYTNDFENSNNSINSINNRDFNNINKSYDITNNRYYNLVDKSMDMNPVFSNDIEAKNNIGKYKAKIINRSNIIEQNCKKFNEYQNDKCRKINMRYSNYNNNDNNYNYNNNKSNNNNINNLKFSFNSIPYKIKLNVKKDKNIFHNYHIDNIDNRMNKSKSCEDIFANRFYLSKLDEYDHFPQIKNLYRHDYLGKKKTDITNNELINNMEDNNKNGYYDYCQKKYEIFLDNKKMLEEKLNQKKNNLQNAKIKEQNEMKMKNIYFNNLNIQKLINLKNAKIKYKKSLDEQIKNNINNKLLNENLTFKDIIQSQAYLIKKNNVSDRVFLNKNKFVEVNPYNHRKYFLGDSSLKNNVIINPQIQYKYNKYIFPEIISN